MKRKKDEIDILLERGYTLDEVIDIMAAQQAKEKEKAPKKEKKPRDTDKWLNILLWAYIIIAVLTCLSGIMAKVLSYQPKTEVIKKTPKTEYYILFPTPAPDTDFAEAEIELLPDDVEAEAYYDSLELLAMCVEAEAGNQSLYGKRLVVSVILNRVEDSTGEWPDDITGVITQPYQFSTWWSGAIERAVPSEETYEAVRLELEERTNHEIFYFTSEGYSKYGTPWQKVEDHYFSTK